MKVMVLDDVFSGNGRSEDQIKQRLMAMGLLKDGIPTARNVDDTENIILTIPPYALNNINLNTKGI